MAHIPLTEWDATVAPLLHAIEDGAQLIQSGCRMVDDAATKITQLPNFTTKSEAELIEARDRLVASLQIADAAILSLSQKEKVG